MLNGLSTASAYPSGTATFKSLRRTLVAICGLGVVTVFGGCGVTERTLESAHSMLPDIQSLPEIPGVYRIDIQQGSVITQDMIDQLQVGMDSRKVRFILGTPSLVDTFNQNRWDYYYSIKKGAGDPSVRRVSVFFDKGLLQRITTYGEIPPGKSGEDAAQRKERMVVVPPRRGDGTIFGSLFGMFSGDDLAPLQEPAQDTPSAPQSEQPLASSEDQPSQTNQPPTQPSGGSSQFVIANEGETQSAGDPSPETEAANPKDLSGEVEKSAQPKDQSEQGDGEGWMARMLRGIGLSGKDGDNTQ